MAWLLRAVLNCRAGCRDCDLTLGIWEFIVPALMLYMILRFSIVLYECYILNCMFSFCIFFIVVLTFNGYIAVTIVLVCVLFLLWLSSTLLSRWDFFAAFFYMRWRTLNHSNNKLRVLSLSWCEVLQEYHNSWITQVKYFLLLFIMFSNGIMFYDISVPDCGWVKLNCCLEELAGVDCFLPQKFNFRFNLFFSFVKWSAKYDFCSRLFRIMISVK